MSSLIRTDLQKILATRALDKNANTGGCFWKPYKNLTKTYTNLLLNLVVVLQRRSARDRSPGRSLSKSRSISIDRPDQAVLDVWDWILTVIITVWVLKNVLEFPYTLFKQPKQKPKGHSICRNFLILKSVQKLQYIFKWCARGASGLPFTLLDTPSRHVVNGAIPCTVLSGRLGKICITCRSYTEDPRPCSRRDCTGYSR